VLELLIISPIDIWKLDIEDNVFAMLKNNNNGRVALLISIGAGFQ